MTKTRKLYQVREEIGGGNSSKMLGRRLRSRTDAQRVANILKKAGRDVFLAPVAVDAKEFNARGRRTN